MQTPSTALVMTKPRLYHAPSSYYSMIARLALVEAGIDTEQVFVDILFRGNQQQPAYARLNPNMTVPTLVLPGRVLRQSREVLDFALIAHENEAGAKTEALVDLHYSFAIEELTFGGFLARHALARAAIPARMAASRRRLLKLAAAHPDLAAAYRERAAVFAQRERVFVPGKAADLLAARRAQAVGFMDQLEADLAHGGAVLVPPGYGAADVVWTVFLARMELVGMAGEIAVRPTLARYWQTMKARPSFARADIWTSFHVARIIRGILLG